MNTAVARFRLLALLLTLSLGCVHTLWAQPSGYDLADSLAPDTSWHSTDSLWATSDSLSAASEPSLPAYELRHFAPDKLAQYRKDPDFVYTEPAREGISWETRFWYWVLDMLGELFSDEGSTPYIRNTVLTVLMLLLLWILLRQRFTGLWQRGHENARIQFHELGNDLQHDFDQLLHEALQAQQYRHAVRILFLRLLRQLSDTQQIAWQAEKTNNQYINELSDREVKQHFRQLVSVYDVVWYGEFEIDATDYASIAHNFQSLHQRIRA